jgi:hypothetical protein
VAARSEAWVCGRSLAGIVGSNPVGDMDVVSVVYYQVELLQRLMSRPEYYRVWLV